MFIANEYLHIKEKEGKEVTEEMVEKLDEMLNQYNVQHFFSEPMNENEDDEIDNVLAIFYEDKDRQTFYLVYMLWCKTVRNIEEQKIWKAMKKAGTNNTKEA